MSCQGGQTSGAKGAPADRIDVPVADLVHHLAHCHSRLRRALRQRLERRELRETEFLILARCAGVSPPGAAQNDLAAVTGVSPAQMSGLVEHLRARGLLVGVRGALDRRRQFWQLTGEGRRCYESIDADLASLAASLGRHLSLDEQRLLASLLQRLSVAVADPPVLRTFVPAVDGAEGDSFAEGGQE
jgi:DNA-binding MarR family transcriptional regulator